MLDKLLNTAVANAKLALAAAAGAALVAGGSAVAITNVADSKPSDVPRASATGVENRSATSTATIKPPKDDTAEQPGVRKDNHGKCVSEAVAKAKAGLAAGAEQGPAVSAAARSCPKPGKGAATAEEKKADAAEKRAEAKKKAEAARTAAEAKKAAGQAHRPADAGPAAGRGPGAKP